ncbi:unnamed protein product [Cyclocybe aegerita]|uniref:BTB domain-containing protein n=1 Tax=Cyclocybe aegerita TaxID=1973307 RepID=A0A8S0VZN1_CYCAE|nr:unnamed protein product [Cyclocybe aegerita]
MTSTKVEKEAPATHPQFSFADADVILVSSEDTCFRVPSFTLRNTCGFFRNLSSPCSPLDGEKTQIFNVDEKDKVLAKVLSMICGLYTENWESIQEVEDALALVQKWDAAGPLSVIRSAITAPVFLAEPLRLYAIATKFGWDEEAQLASTRTLTLDLYDEAHKPNLERLSARHLMMLLRLHRSRRDEFKRLVDGDGVFEAGNSSRYLCSGCGEPLNNYTWRELKARMFMEMDRRPLGDSLCSLEMEEWPEALACWTAKCQKNDCGRPNYNKLETLRDIRGCIDRLPLHIW